MIGSSEYIQQGFRRELLSGRTPPKTVRRTSLVRRTNQPARQPANQAREFSELTAPSIKKISSLGDRVLRIYPTRVVGFPRIYPTRLVGFPKIYPTRLVGFPRIYSQRRLSAFRRCICNDGCRPSESTSKEVCRLSETISNEDCRLSKVYLTRLVGYLRIYPTRVFSAFRAYMQRGVCVCVFNFGLDDRDLKPKTSKWRSSMSIVNIRQRLALTREIFRTMKYGKRESYIFVSGSR